MLFAELFFFPPSDVHPLWFFAPAAAACILFFLKVAGTGAEADWALSLSAVSALAGGALHIYPPSGVALVPIATLAAAFFGRAVIITVWASVALAHSAGLARAQADAFFVLGAAYLSGGLAYFSAKKLGAQNRKLRARPQRESSFFSPGNTSLRQASEEEIEEALRLARDIVGADSVSLFLAEAGGLSVGFSTAGDVKLSAEGCLWLAFRKKQPVVLGNLAERGQNPGYLREARISSFMAYPVTDGGITIGVVAADSPRPGVFGQRQQAVFGAIPAFLARMLGRQRAFRELNRKLEGFEVIKEESSRLLQTFEVEKVAREAANGARRIADTGAGGIGAALFVKQAEGFRLAGLAGVAEPPEKTFRDFRGSLLESAIRSREHVYLSDLSSYQLPPLPFEAGPIKAASLHPLVYEDDTLGVLAVVSSMKDPLTAYQVELVKMFAGQVALTLSRALLHEKLRLLASTDGLTGLFNHRHFQERLSEEFRRLGRYPRPISLLLVDIDYFKKVNDTYGHPAGDAVLRQTAAIIRRVVRDTDIPARYGGEEFAALLVDTDKPGALQVAERLRKTISGSAFPVDQPLNRQILKITVSIGLACCPSDAGTKEELVELADKALYRAKHGGRNKVEQA